MSIRRGVLNTLGLLVLAAAVFYSFNYWPNRMQLLPEDDATGNNAPDYRIADFHAIDLDEAGRLRYELTASELVHYPQPERADLTAPEMVFYRSSHGDKANPPAEPWQLVAATGRITDGGDRLDLEGDVRVTRVAAAETPAAAAPRMMLEAERLTVYGRQEVATTDGPVRLTADRAHLQGTGMQIDLKKGQMHLLSQVRGSYDPR